MSELTRENVRAVADAHRAALLRGDIDLAGNAVETRLLHAIVTDSAARASTWIATRVPDGATVAEPLKTFTAEVAARDSVGKAVQAVDQELYRRAKSLVSSLVWTGTAPVWLGAVAGFAVALCGFLYEGGFNAGSTLFGLLAGGGSLAAVSMLRTAQYGPKAVSAVGSTAVRSMDAASSIGAAAERVYRDQVNAAVTEMYGRLGAPPVVPTVLARVRGYATAVVGAAWFVLGVAVLVALGGLYDGFTSAASTSPYGR